MTFQNRAMNGLMLGMFLTLSWGLNDQRAAAEDHPDRVSQPGVPEGTITAGVFKESQLFPGTRRNYSVYVPAQYKADEPAALMVFMDGSGYAKKDGGCEQGEKMFCFHHRPS